MKRKIVVLIALCCISFCFATIVKATELIDSGTCGDQGDNLTWTLDTEGHLTISGTGKMKDYAYSSDAPWNEHRNAIKSIIVEAGVASIGEWAFEDCKNVRDVFISDTVTSLGYGAFYDCSELVYIVIPDSVTSISNNVFCGCTKISTAGPIGGGYNYEYGWSERIPDYAFYDCDALTYVSIPAGIVSIGRDAFGFCKSLKNINLPEGVTSLGEGAFFCCEELENIRIPGTVTTIGKSTFYNCNKLTSAGPFGGGYHYEFGWTDAIPANAFGECTSLVSAVIPDGVNTIGYDAFYNCSSLAYIVVPNSVSKIGGGAFFGCKELKSAGPIGGGYNYEFGWTDAIPAYAFVECEKLSEVSIPDSIIEIGEAAFRQCKSLTNVVIPDGVTKIESGAFRWCSSLSHIVIPESVTYTGGGSFLDGPFYGCIELTSAGSIGGGYSIEFGWTETIPDNAFCGCSGLKKIVIPDGIKNIGEEAFAYCSSLEKIIIPKSVVSIGDVAFYDCQALTSGGPIGGDYCYEYGWTEEIPDNAFLNCKGLNTISILKSITHIGKLAFANTGLESINIPGNVVQIGQAAFSGCSSLSRVLIQEGVERIGDNAFFNCENLTDISLPVSVSYIGSKAFSGCNKLSDVYYGGSEELWDEIEYGYYYRSGHYYYDIGLNSDSSVHFNIEGIPVPKGLAFNENYTLTVGSTINISAVYTGGESPAGSDVRWISSDRAVYPAGETSFLDLPDSDPIIHWVYSRPITASKAGTYDVTLYVGDLSATTQVVVTDPGAEIRKKLASGGEIVFAPSGIGNKSSATEGTSFTVTALIPGGAALANNNGIQWYQYSQEYLDGHEVLLQDTDRAGEYGEAYSSVTVTVPGTGSSLRLRLQLSDGRNALYYIDSVAKKSDTVTAIQRANRPLYSVQIPTASRTFSILPQKQEELYMEAYGQDGNRLTGNAREKISSILWESSDSTVIAFDQNGASSLTHNGAKTEGWLIHWESEETDSVILYARSPGTAKITCTITIDGKPYVGSRDVTVPGYEAETLDRHIKQWVSAYDEYTKAVEKAMDKAAKSSGETASFAEIGAELQKADQSRPTQNRMVSPNTDNPVIISLVYETLAKYMADYVPQDPDFGGIKVSGDITSFSSGVIRAAFAPAHSIYENHEGVTLSGYGYGGAAYGSFNYNGRTVATIINSPDATKKTMEAFISGLVRLDKNLVDHAYKEALKEVFTTDLSHAVLDGVKETVKTNLTEYAGAFFRSGAGNAAQIFKNCLDYYDYVKKVSDAARSGASNPIQAISALKDLKFEYEATSLRDATVEAYCKKMNEAANGITNWLDKWSDGKPLPKAAIEVWNLLWSFQCPVNVAVYDSAGTQIGYVGEDDIWFNAERIYIENFGDEKRIYSNGEPLTFKAVGEDYGTMNCSFATYDGGEEINRTNYYDIPLSEGAEINVSSPDGSITESSLVITAGGEQIEASESFKDTEYEDASVTIRCRLSNENGGEVIGSGNHIRGDMVTLQAFSDEGYVFTGWINSSGSLLSTSPVYEFTARDNMLLTAVFSEDIQISETDNAAIYNLEGEKGDGEAYASASVSALNGDSITVYCSFYDENGRMLDAQSQTITSDGEQMLVFVTKSATAASAKFFALNSQFIPQCGSKEISFAQVSQ